MKYYYSNTRQITFLSVLFFCAACTFDLAGQGKTSAIAGYGKASYEALQTGKFMKNWLVAGPVAVSADSTFASDSLQERVFKEDILSTVPVVAGKPVAPLHVKQKNLEWRLVSSADDVIDLDSLYNARDYAYAYALAEIKAPASMIVILGVGSDDAVKVWLNGKLVHENMIARGVNKDDDQVPLKLVKGSNQVLIKVQDEKGGWAFVSRILDKPALSAGLIAAAGKGDLEKIKILIQGGADVNVPDASGVTPVIAAKISGRDEVLKLLLSNGAKDEPVPSAEVVVDNMYAGLKGKEAPGIAILVARDSNILYKKGFGYADIKNSVPVTADTKFRIGSVTKQFTAAAILKLQENKVLNIHDKLSRFIPDFPRGDEVTIHELLTHTSGIHSFTSKSDFEKNVTASVIPDSLIRSIEKDPYDFNPGENMLYNNSGYFLLGYIIGKVSGKSYADYLKENFFDPLHMNNTGVHYAGIQLAHEAKGYARTNNNYSDALNWDMSWAGGAGALYSTVEDLLKWNRALYGGKVLGDSSLRLALTPVTLKNGVKPSMNYGYGLGFNKYRGLDNVGHGGGLHGFITQLVYYPKEKLSIVMFSNTATPEVNFDANKIAEAFLWTTMNKQPSYAEAAAKPRNLQAFAGRYDFLSRAVLTVSVQDNRLYAQLTGQPRFEIYPSSEDEFFWKVVEARIKFFKNDKGETDHAVFHQNGQEITAKKLKDEKIIDINPGLLDNYEGKYKHVSGLIVTVFKEGNKLFAQATNQPKFEMSPVSETAFYLKEINAKISFPAQPNGKADRLTLNMNGMDSELPRIE